MSIKPVLVPDHDAAELRKLMDTFSEAATGPVKKQLNEMDYGGGRSPHAGMGLPRDDLDDVSSRRGKEIIVKPETAKKTVKSVGDQLDQAFAQAYNDKGVAEGFNRDILDKLKKSWDWLSFKDEREGKQETGEEWAARYMKDLEGQRQDEREGKPIRRNRAKDEMLAKTFSDRDERDVDEGVAEGSVSRGDLYNVVIEYFNGGKGHRNAMALRKKAESGMSAKNLAVLLNDFSKKKWGSTLNGSDAIDAVKNIVYPYDFDQGVAEEQLDELSVHKMLKYSDAAEKDRDALNQKWDNRTASEKEKERVLRHEKGEQRAADKIKQKTGKLPVQIGKLDRLKHAITREGVAEGKKRSDRYHIVGKDGNPASLASYADQASAVKDRDKKHPGAEVRQVGPRGKIKGVSEGFMDTVKQAFNDAVVGHPMGTSDEQFIQGWARAIQAETGRDIPLEKLTQLYQDYVERSDELMQSHGTTNEESAESLAEFAPPDSGDGGGDDDGFDEDTLRKLAAQWFAGDEDPQVERLLAAAGWEIGQDEGYDDEPGVFVVMSGDDDGRSYMSWPAEELRSDVAEARPDVMRHKGDTTVKVVKRRGKPIGEIGIDAEASPGNGAYYVKLYDGSYDAVGFDTAEEALAELRYAIKSAGSGPDTSFGGPSGWTGPVKEQQVDELSPKTLGSYIKKSSADAAERQGDVTGRNQFGKGAEFAVKAFYGDQIQPNPTRTDPRIAKRQAGVDQAVDRLTKEDVAAAFKPGDRVMYAGKFATVIAQDGDTYGIRIDAQPGTMMVPVSQIKKPSYDESVAESIDPVEQLRADIRRFAL